MILTNFAFLDLGTPELLIILAIILLLFGGKRLPQLSKSLGESMRELRKGMSDGYHEDTKSQDKPKEAESTDTSS